MMERLIVICCILLGILETFYCQLAEKVGFPT